MWLSPETEMNLFGPVFEAFGVFFHPRPEGVWVIALIIAVAVWSAWGVYRVRLHLNEETRALAVLRDSLSHKLSGTVQLKDLDHWVANCPADSLVTKAVRTIWAARTVPNPDLEAIATMLAQSEASRLGGVRNAPNRLLLLGLLGTVAGLAGVVATLGPQIQGTLQSADPLVLTRNLGVTLQHMRDAFACTAWGIATAICIAWWTGQVAAQQSRFLADLQEFGLRELAPKVFPCSQESQLNEVRHILAQSQEFLQNVAQIMNSAAEQFKRNLTDAGQHMTHGVGQLSTVATTMQSSLASAALEVRESAERLESSTKDLHQYHESLKVAYSQLLQLFDQSKKEMERQSREQLEKIGHLQEAFGGSAQSILDQVAGAAGKMSEATGSFHETGKKFEISGMEVTHRLDGGFKWLTETLNATLTNHEREMRQVDGQLRLIGEQLRELGQRLDPRMLPRDEWEAVRDSLTKCVTELGRIQNERIGLEELVRRLDAATGGFTQVSSGPIASGNSPSVGAAPELLTALGAVVERLDQIGRLLEGASFPGGRAGAATTMPDSRNGDLQRELRQLHNTIQSLDSRQELGQMSQRITGIQKALESGVKLRNPFRWRS